MSTTLATLRTLAFMFLDDPDQNNWDPDDIDIYINESESSLWTKLCEADESFGLREAVTTLVQAQVDYDYPSDILGRNVRALHAYSSATDNWYRVKKKGYEQVVNEPIGQKQYPNSYCCMDGYFKIGPPPDDSGFILRLAYTRQPTEMTADSSQMDSDDEFAELIAIDAAIRAIMRKGGDTNTLKILTAKKEELFTDAIQSITPNDFIDQYPTQKY